MLEESTMDAKKSAGRPASAPAAKSAGSEAKVKQDAVTTNKVPRSGRRRESPCPRTEPPSRKPPPQRNKVFDKRSRPRGQFCYDRDRSEVAVDHQSEIGSALQQGSKKMNLNHLLNFTYAPRDSNAHPSHWNGGSWKGRSKWSTKKHKYNKEQFLQASCQFVVKADGDYSMHESNADRLVEWDAIELVRLSGHEVPSCPICLYQPIAAKITRCGHIYCWPCILHYLALSDKEWRKCPICFEAVHKKDLKSVVALPTHQYIVGEEIRMRLMKREKGSVFTMAVSSWEDRSGQPFHVNDGAEQTCFSKILTALPEEVQELIIAREYRELQIALEENKDCPEVCFVEAALQLLSQREQMLKDQYLNLMTKMRSSVTPTTICAGKTDLKANVPSQPPRRAPGCRIIVYQSAFDDIEEQPVKQDDPVKADNSVEAAENSEVAMADDAFVPEVTELYYAHQADAESVGMDSKDGSTDITAEDLDFSSIHISGPSAEKNSPKDAFYYFYQAADGQHIYLHALNVKMLVKEYGSLDMCPDTITAKIVEQEGISMSEDLRRRLRYLCHLPLTCEFVVVELQFRPPFISKERIALFADELEKRRIRRTKKARAERKREKHIEEQENIKWGKYPKSRLNLDSVRQFPDCSSTSSNVPDFPLMLSAASTSLDESPSTLSSPTTSSVSSYSRAAASCDSLPVSPIGSLDDHNCSSTPSFAQMLRQGKLQAASKSNELPQFESVNIGSRAKHRGAVDSESEPEDYVPAPDYHQSFGNAIQDALQKAVNAANAGQLENVSAGNRCVRKKNRKQKLLFTTSMARNK